MHVSQQMQHQAASAMHAAIQFARSTDATQLVSCTVGVKRELLL